MKIYVYIFLMVSAFMSTLISPLAAQEMTPGFELLEKGDFAEAKRFFSVVLGDYPENKTARLCYGRATGLSGNPEEAGEIFKELLLDYKDDLEIELNYAECLLWQKKYVHAKSYYSTLLQKVPENFVVNLGLANTLSNLKEYPGALSYVNKALEITPNQPNAKISKKYIQLAYAAQSSQYQNYDLAVELLHKNLELFPEDKESLRTLAEVYINQRKLDKAETVFVRLSDTKEDFTRGLLGLALVSHSRNRDLEALDYAEKALASLDSLENGKLFQQTKERYIQALIWNGKYAAAENEIELLKSKYKDQKWVLALQAMLYTYRSEFKKGIDEYENILEKDSTSFDGNLGSANAYKALDRWDIAADKARKTLEFYPNQKDASMFLRNIQRDFAPTLDLKVNHTRDNGKNVANGKEIKLGLPLSLRLSFLAQGKLRNTQNDQLEEAADSKQFLAGAKFKLFPHVYLKAMGGILQATTNTSSNEQFLADFSINAKPSSLQWLSMGYKRELQDFNTSLIEENILQEHFYLNYTLATNFKLGSYHQLFYTKQSDGNNRKLYFTSLYYNIAKNPFAKAGLNYQYISFDQRVPEIYFSPETFHAVEFFIDSVKEELSARKKEWYYTATAATGFQFIDGAEKQWTYRLKFKLGYVIHEQLLVHAYAERSNIASATAAGFTFTDLGIGCKWYVGGKPIFKLGK